MHVFITTVGTRGDVQPYVALGAGLLRAGHTVTLCASKRFEPLIVAHGLRYGYMNDGLLELLDSDRGRAAVEGASNLVDGLRTYVTLAREMGPLQRRMVDDSWESARTSDADVIVHHPKAYWGPYFAAKLSVPVIFAPLIPMFVPTSERPNLGFPDLGLGGSYTRATYRIVLRLSAMGTDRYMSAWSKREGVPRRPRRTDILHDWAGKPTPVIHGYSRHVAPAPRDWPPHVTATGYWWTDDGAGWQPPGELAEFLASGPAPVYVGFGSMVGRDPATLARTVVGAVARAGVRAVLATGRVDTLGPLPPTVLRIREAPHEWLFPRMAAIVHHGGAGTTAAALRAGRPSVVCPFFGDQPFWGRRIEALGAGVAPIPQKRLTADRLADALRQVTTGPTFRHSAEAVGRLLLEEDGVGQAVDTIEQVVSFP